MSLPDDRPLSDDAIHVWRVPWLHRNAAQGALPILADCLGVHVHALAMDVGEHGKPTLAAPFAHVGFSWSHSGEQALLAAGAGLRNVGVDLERVRPRPRLLALARRFFAAEEADLLEATPAAEQLHAFLALWTAKEAVLKAHGGGLVYGLHRVVFGYADTPTPSRFDGEIGPAARWQVRELHVGAGFHAHVAWSGRDRPIIFMNELEPGHRMPV
jgi:4'-phosphopantetheinyl transferase